jgi:hypothetical protein
MSPEIYLHEQHDFSDLIRVVAGERRIDPYLVEKDYWLVHSLYGLQKAGYDFQLKGGTSLSKGFFLKWVLMISSPISRWKSVHGW